MPAIRSLGRAQQVIQRTFNTTATVMRKTSVADNSGGFVDSYDAVATYPCSFSHYQITPLERNTNLTVTAITVWMFVFAHDVDILYTDRLVTPDLREFEVVSPAKGSYEVATRVLCQEVI